MARTIMILLTLVLFQGSAFSQASQIKEIDFDLFRQAAKLGDSSKVRLTRSAMSGQDCLETALITIDEVERELWKNSDSQIAASEIVLKGMDEILHRGIAPNTNRDVDSHRLCIAQFNVLYALIGRI